MTPAPDQTLTLSSRILRELEEDDRDFCVGLYRERKGKPGVVIFIADDKDWDSRHLNRHGDRLASARATPECAAYRDGSFRAQSLHFNGEGRQRADGLDRDLTKLGFSPEIRAQFLEAAKPFWPDEKQ